MGASHFHLLFMPLILDDFINAHIILYNIMIFKFRIVFAQGRKRVCMESGKTDEWAEKWIRLNKNVADRK